MFESLDSDEKGLRNSAGCVDMCSVCVGVGARVCDAAINVIPDYPPHGLCRGQHRGFSCISHRFVPQGRGISSFSEPRRLKETY